MFSPFFINVYIFIIVLSAYEVAFNNTAVGVAVIYWKQWKKVSARFDNLKKLGINKYKAWEWANSRKGYWRISDSWILSMSLTNKYLASVGYDDIYQRYKVLHSNY